MYKRIPTRKLTGEERFVNTGSKSFSVLDLWRYGFSNVNSNIQRGVVAEFIVEYALKAAADTGVRDPWKDYDILSPGGKKIEVKCSAYLQDWDQNEFSRITWSGLKARDLFFSSALNTNKPGPPDYKADAYVLALWQHQDPATLDILNMDQWCFYVLRRDRVKELSKNGNSLSLICLQKHRIAPVVFAELAAKVEDPS